MKRLLGFGTLFLCLSAFIVSDEVHYGQIDHNSFGRGEVLNYKLNFGFFTIGKAKMKVSDDLYNINYRNCYKVDIYGKTVGVVDWVADIDDQWGAYVDTAAIVPHIAYRKIREGKYKKDEVVRFDHKTNMIEAKVKNQKTGKFKEPMYYSAPKDIRDLISGFLYLRTVNFSGLALGDTVAVQGFFEDTFYDMQIIYKGKEVIKTKAGKFNTVKLVPIMPDNKLFDGENSITTWLTDDENRVPVKLKAEMFIGSAGVELTGYSGLKNEVNLAKKKR
ncbi:MAG: DUF3108 domain-containing protein [Bacteroidota bacterium]